MKEVKPETYLAKPTGLDDSFSGLYEKPGDDESDEGDKEEVDKYTKKQSAQTQHIFQTRSPCRLSPLTVRMGCMSGSALKL